MENVVDDDDNPTFSGYLPSSLVIDVLNFVDKAWIRKLVQWAGKNFVSDVAFPELLQQLVMIGGGKIEDIALRALSIVFEKMTESMQD